MPGLSNENTNGLLPQYSPKGTDPSKLSARDLDGTQRSLNGRPGETRIYETIRETCRASRAHPFEPDVPVLIGSFTPP